MSQNMYGIKAQVYVPLGSGHQYLADPATGIISAVADGDVAEMVRMGCIGTAMALAAGAASAVLSVDTRTGAVTLGHGDVAGLSLVPGDVTGLGTAAVAATTAFDAAGAATTAQANAIAGATSIIAASAKHALIAGGAAGNFTVTGIQTTHTLAAVLRLVAAGTTMTNITDITGEFTITAPSTINNTSGTNTTGDKLLVLWTATS